MIEGHGNDLYRYSGIRTDFSSNICPHADHTLLMAHLAHCGSRLVDSYPEPDAASLAGMIADYHGIAPTEVLVTNGATDAIYLIAQTFSMRSYIPMPTFSEYGDACRMFGRELTIAEPQAGSHPTMLWLCNPNNPTGTVTGQSRIDLLMARNGLLVLDHSYEHYTDKPVMSARWGVRTPFSLQIHSFTKNYGVPGLRLGYITGHRRLIAALRCRLRPWSVSAMAIEAGKFLLAHDELLCRPDLAEARRLFGNLNRLEHVTVRPTDTNFMLARIDCATAAELKTHLATVHGMLIRDASNFSGLDDHYFRVAAQSAAEDDALVAAITDFITQKQNSPT